MNMCHAVWLDDDIVQLVVDQLLIKQNEIDVHIRRWHCVNKHGVCEIEYSIEIMQCVNVA